MMTAPNLFSDSKMLSENQNLRMSFLSAEKTFFLFLGKIVIKREEK
jgi:hypothetical protein